MTFPNDEELRDRFGEIDNKKTLYMSVVPDVQKIVVLRDEQKFVFILPETT